MSSSVQREPKFCATCGRTFNWRRKWAHSWESVRHCSTRCSGRRNHPADRSLEEGILSLLRQRPPGATICPSEVARAASPDKWRALMEAVRCAARRLAERNRIEVTQGGHAVDPSSFRGPIRLRLLDSN